MFPWRAAPSEHENVHDVPSGYAPPSKSLEHFMSPYNGGRIIGQNIGFAVKYLKIFFYLIISSMHYKYRGLSCKSKLNTKKYKKLL